jgi:ferric-dicitrate binding protein FerR (iron transport regulator)
MTDRCPMAALVEARASGRVGEHEAPALERHVAGCAECTELARDLGRLAELARRPVPPRSELDQRRARMRLLRDAAKEPRPHARRAVVAIAFAAAAAAIVGVVELGRHGGPAPIAAAPTAASASIQAAPAARTTTIVRGEDGARFTRVEEGGVDRVALESGAVTCSVRPLGVGERFLVTTSDGEVEVHGTIFRVRAEDGHLRGVDVSEGKVEVRAGGRAFFLAAGEGWAATSAPRADASGSPSATPSARADARPAASARAGAPRAPTADGDALFADGVESLGRGDYEAAVRRLAAFRERAPHDPRAEDAAMLAVVALDRAGKKAEAKAAAARYLADFPAGHRAGEARAIVEAP